MSGRTGTGRLPRATEDQLYRNGQRVAQRRAEHHPKARGMDKVRCHLYGKDRGRDHGARPVHRYYVQQRELCFYT